MSNNIDFELFLQAKIDESQIRTEISRFNNKIDLKVNIAVDDIKKAQDQLQNSFKGASAPSIDISKIMNSLKEINVAGEKGFKFFLDAKGDIQALNTTITNTGGIVDTLKYKLKDLGEGKSTLTLVGSEQINKTEAYNNKLAETKAKMKELISLKQQDIDIELRKISSSNKSLMGNSNVINEINNINKLRNSYDGSATSTNKLNLAMKSLKTTIIEQGHAFRETNDRSASFMGTIEHLFQKFSLWIGVSTVFMQTIRAIQDGVQTIVQLDTSMIGLQKVTNETSTTYRNFLIDINQVAKSLGHTTSAAIDATTAFAKLNYSLKDSQTLAQTALIYSNIGDVDINESTQSIISTMKGFGLEAQNATNIIDKFNEVGNNFSVTSGGIGSALQRSSASLAEANNTLDESIGLIVAANASVQDTSRVGNALKTISMRVRGIDDATGEAIPKLQETIKMLSGVDIMKDSNTFKSTYDIMVELSKIWDNLTDKKRATLLELLAGKQQGTVLASLLTNMKDGISATETAINSAGSAAAEQSKYMESITAKANAFKETVTELWINTVDTDSIKILIDSGTQFIGVLSTFSKYLGGLSVPLMTVITIWSLFNKQLDLSKINLTHLFSNDKIITEYVTKMNLAGQSLHNFNNLSKSTQVQIASTSLGYKTFGTIIDLVRIKQIALNAVIGFGMGALISFAIQGISTAIDAIVNYKKNLEEAFSTAQNAVNSLKSDVRTVESAMAILNDSTSSTSELAQARQQLIDTLGTGVIEGYDLEGKAILKNNEALKTALKLKEYELELAKEQEKSKADEAQGSLISDYQNSKRKLQQLKEQQRFSYDQDGFNPLIKDELFKQIQLLSKLNNNHEKYGSIITEEIRQDIEAAVAKTKLNNGLEKTQEHMTKAIEMAKTYTEAIGEVANVISKPIENPSNLNDYEKEQKQFSEALAKANERMEDMRDNMLDLSNAYDSLKDGGTLEVKTLEELIKKYPQVAEYISKTNDLTLDRGKILKKIYDDNAAQAKKDLDIQNEAHQKDLDRLDAKIIIFQKVLDLMTGAKKVVNDFLGVFGQAPTTVLDSGTANLQKLINDTKETRKEIEKEKKANNAIKALYDKDVSSFNGDKKDKKDKKDVDNLDLKIERLYKYNKLLEDNQNLLNKNKAEQDISQEGKKLQLQKDEIELMKQRQNLLHTTNEERRKMQTELESELGKSGFKFDNGNITNLNERLTQLQNSANSKTGVAKETAIDGVKKLQEQTEKYIKLVQQDMPSASEEWLKLQKTINETTLDRITKNFAKEKQKLSDAMKDLTDQESLLADDDYVGKTKNLSDQIAQQELIVKETERQFNELNNTTDEGIKSQEGYATKLKELGNNAKDAKQELASLNKEQDKNIQDNIEKYEKYQISVLQDEIDARKDIRDEIEKYYETKLTSLENEYNKQKKTNDENQRAIEIEKARLQLANAQNEKNTKVYREGQGWVWEVNNKDVTSAKDNLEKLLQEQKDADSEAKYNKDKEKLEKKKKTELDKFDATTKEAELFKKKLSKLLDDSGENITDFDKLISSIPKEWAAANPKTMKLLTTLQSESAKKLKEMKSDLQSYLDMLNKVTNKKSSGSGSVDWSVTTSVTVTPGANPGGQPPAGSGYANGGIVDYTGLAMVHGSQAKPEYVFNNNQMKTFIHNVLSGRVGGSGNADRGYIINIDKLVTPNVSDFVRQLNLLVKTS